jgi:hypothetical protein
MIVLVLMLVLDSLSCFDHEQEHEHDYEGRLESRTIFPSRISSRREAARATSSL